MKTKYVFIISMLVAFFSCTEKKLEPISASLGKPGVVTDVISEALPGGVLLTYRIPNTEDLLEVKAVYTLSNGKTYEQSSSFYENKMKIEGFNDTNEHQIHVYTVNRAQIMSDPVTVSFTPLEPPLAKIARSISIISDFGGAQFRWENVDKYPINLEFFTPDSLGRMQLMRIITSELPEANLSLRGYTPDMRTFATLIRDNYGNATDTIKQTLLPFFEEKFNKTKMSIMKLSSDKSFTNWEGMDSYLIDDDKSTFGHSASNSIPTPFTIDLGAVGQVSRVVMFNRLFDDSYYSWGNPKDIEIYGRLERPSMSGDWSEWGNPIVVGELRKPSGLPSGTDTDEDIAYAEAGFEFVFPLDVGLLRYIRIVILSTQTGPTFTHPTEVDVYGEVKN
ncbi:hypothetical protein EZS27_020085 [termite gut metagenome]|uniref:F5/8 type C domain-containing protein n=1 Tax=termite gut metagenome TaxID=433724 RepID=A0A5J4RC91_9ZZZZ